MEIQQDGGGKEPPGAVLTGTLVLGVYQPLELWPMNFCGYKFCGWVNGRDFKQTLCVCLITEEKQT